MYRSSVKAEMGKDAEPNEEHCGEQHVVPFPVEYRTDTGLRAAGEQGYGTTRNARADGEPESKQDVAESDHADNRPPRQVKPVDTAAREVARRRTEECSGEMPPRHPVAEWDLHRKYTASEWAMERRTESRSGADDEKARSVLAESMPRERTEPRTDDHAKTDGVERAATARCGARSKRTRCVLLVYKAASVVGVHVRVDAGRPRVDCAERSDDGARQEPRCREQHGQGCGSSGNGRE